MPHTSFFPVSTKASLWFPPLFQSLCWQKERGSHRCLRKQESQPTRTVTRLRRRRPWLIKSELRTQLRGGDPGLARQMQAGQSPPKRGGKKLLRGTSRSGSTVLGQNRDRGSPRQDPGSDRTRCSHPIPTLYNCLYSLQQTHSSRHRFSLAGKAAGTQ